MDDVKYLFVIDTEDYSGNLERDLCAYVTGRVGECGAGEEFAAFFDQETLEVMDFVQTLQDKVISVPDDRGCSRPCVIWPTPGWFNNGNGGHFREDEKNVESKAIKARYEEAKETYGGYIKQTERTRELSEAERNLLGWTEEAIEREVARHKKSIEESQTRPLQKFPAYQSVAIWFSERPTKEEIDFMIHRAKKFNEAGKETKFFHPITITGYRLLEEKTTYTELNKF